MWGSRCVRVLSAAVRRVPRRLQTDRGVVVSPAATRERGHSSSGEASAVRLRRRPSQTPPRDTNESIFQNPGVIRCKDMDLQTLADYLFSNTIYNTGGLIALNKPAGLPMTTQAGVKNEQLSLEDVLEEMAVRYDVSTLKIVKGLERECSGVVLLSTSREQTLNVTQTLQKARRQGRPTLTFLAVVIGVPVPLSGVIDIPLAQENIDGNLLTVPRSSVTKGQLQRGEVKKTKTLYEVLTSTDQCSLLQLQPITAYKHQVRVHLTTKLCSVLGDHLYSARVSHILGHTVFVDYKHASPRTQVLPNDLYRMIHVPRRLMLRMPLHLHCWRLTLPGGAGPVSDRGAKHPPDFTVTAPLPEYFTRSLQLLGVSSPDQIT